MLPDGAIDQIPQHALITNIFVLVRNAYYGSWRICSPRWLVIPIIVSWSPLGLWRLFTLRFTMLLQNDIITNLIVNQDSAGSIHPQANKNSRQLTFSNFLGNCYRLPCGIVSTVAKLTSFLTFQHLSVCDRTQIYRIPYRIVKKINTRFRPETFV